MRRSWFLAVVLVASSSAAQNGGESDEFFESRVRPVLADNCFICHTDQALGSLRLDSREAV